MDKKVKAKWLKALRSGRYEQSANCLRSDKSSFCCLGVLCQIVKPRDWEQTGGGWYFSEDAYSYPPPDFLKQVGLHSKSAKRLARMNDKGRDFEYIARQIERLY
jgi:hypothetical protein